MKKIMKILDTNNYSINIKNDFKDLKKINAYYPTFKTVKLLDKILGIVNNGYGNSILLSGAYGTGKSYFISILLSILDKDFKVKNFHNFLEKSNKSYEIEKTLMKFEDKKYFVVFIEDSVNIFSKGLLLGLNKSAIKEGVKLNLTTQYEIIEEKIENWKKNYSSTYLKFKNLFVEEEEDNFNSLLKTRDEKALIIFSTIYSKMFSGEEFSSLEKVYNVEELLKESEKQILELGWDGIVYVFDEFGRYLETNINTIDVKEIQDMAEYCSRKNESTMIMITHKDIFNYSGRLKNKDKKDEWEKVSGRFLKEHLIYEKMNVQEIVKNILVKNEYSVYREKNIEVFKRKEKLLENLKIIDSDAKIVTENFYPLDYLTMSILPEISQNMAQNERTLFAFLCSDEDKSLKNIIESSQDIFVSLDKIYDYFEETFKELSSESRNYKLYLQGKNILSKLSKNEIKEKKFIKNLVLIYMYNKFIEIEPTPKIMKYLLNYEDIETIEKNLKDKNLISYRRQNNYYKIVENIDINIDKEVKEIVETKLSNFNYMETLEEYLKKEPYFPLKYNDKNKINRYFGQYYLDVSEISRLEEIKLNIYEDGKIIYLINIEGNNSYKEIEKNLKDNGYIVLSNSNDEKLEILDNLKEIKAIEEMMNNYEEDIIKEELSLYKIEILTKIKKDLKNYFDTDINLLDVTNEYLEKKYCEYIPLNYELINKHNFSVPMKKIRKDILEKLKNKIKMEDSYFSDTKAESSVARIFIKNSGFYNNELTMENSKYYLIISEVLEEIKIKKISIEELYRKYCSIESCYGIRKGIFTFIIGLIIVDNWEQISLINNITKNEIEFDFSILDTLEKEPEKYEIVYYKIEEDEMKYMKKLESYFINYISKKEDKIYNKILLGMKNYMLTLPRYMTQIYMEEFKSLNKVFRGIFAINSGKQFLLKEIPKAYKKTLLNNENDYNVLLECFNKDLLEFKNCNKEFLNFLIQETITVFGKKELSLKEFIMELEKDNNKNEVIQLIISLKLETEENIMKVLTENIKGYSFENWSGKDDIEDYRKKLQEKINLEEKERKIGIIKTLKIVENKNEKIIDLSVEETVLGKMLYSKLKSTIKNMGTSISEKEKLKILSEILLEM